MYTITDFKVGDRVELHPATDWWMRGGKYGTVTKVGTKRVHVKLDRTGGVVTMLPIHIHSINP